MRSGGHLLVALVGALLLPARLMALDPPADLPRYGLDIRLDVDGHVVQVKERVTWTNRHPMPARELIFNAHSHYSIPDSEIGFMAKMLELLRMTPSDSLDFNGPPLEIESVMLGKAVLPFDFAKDNATALVVALPAQVRQGESVTVDVCFRLRLPQKQGRWGQWRGLTTLATWLPVVAHFDEEGWHPAPFIPWHQPFFNEAGHYTAVLTLPVDQQIASGAVVKSVCDVGNGCKQITFAPFVGRDFPFLASAEYKEQMGHAGRVKVRCMYLPGHEHFAERMVQWVCESIPQYEQLIGPYPYDEFTVAEAYFGWNGNECSGLVMIDERVFTMPKIGAPFVEHLVSHELMHQWFYNVVGTNGYAETWMDEGVVGYLSHQFIDRKCGRNNAMLQLPKVLAWLPNIHRDTYRSYGLYGTIGRGEAGPTVQEMPGYGHLVNLLSMCYDRGGRVIGMIENRMGKTAFYDFIRIIYRKYYFRILRVRDFHRELEAYTGQSWEQFFKEWVYGSGFVDWAIEGVTVKPLTAATGKNGHKSFLAALHTRPKEPCEVTILLRQKADYNEPTIVGIALDDPEVYEIRLPVCMTPHPIELHDPPALLEGLPDNRVRIKVTLPNRPAQITVDPDQVLVDKNPVNNSWKPRVKWRFTPVYTPLEETDLTTDYDKWNVIFGPGFFTMPYVEPWYERATIVGARASIYRLQNVHAGADIGYRTDYRDVAVGVDGLWDHALFPKVQLGFHAERSLTAIDYEPDRRRNRGVLFGRYVFQYGSSLYLPPMHYVEAFGTFQRNALPLPRYPTMEADHFDVQATAGLHYRIDYLTPYWDPEGGFRFDATVETGMPILGEQRSFNRGSAQFSTVKGLPAWTGPLSQTRVAVRVYGAGGLPEDGQFYPLGGNTLFRGFDLRERQGNAVWIGSAEWRIPIVRRVEWDCYDHLAGLRNLYLAPFYDVGTAYLNHHSLGDIAHAVGIGVRADVVLFSLIERMTLRFDIAKTINVASPMQFWFGITQPF